MTSFEPPRRRQVEDLLDRFARMRVAVVGDLMLDRFLYGAVERISPEAPVPVVDVERELFRLGGAANVVHNLRTLGAAVELLGAVGRDAYAETIREELRALGLSCGGLLAVDDRPTSLKTRVIASHQQIVRVDREKRGPLPAETIAGLLGYLEERLSELDAVIVSDYGKGLVSPTLMGRLLVAARSRGVLVCVDPKPQNGSCYVGADAMTPNAKEAEAMSGLAARSDDEAAAAARALLEASDGRAVLLTRGEKGVTLVEREGDVTHIPTQAREVFDVTGAGDTAISAFTLAWAAGSDLKLAAYVANAAAGIVVGKLGTATVTREELRRNLADDAAPGLEGPG